MFEEKLEQFSTIRHCEILADQMKTINLLEINYDIFQQKLDELQEAYRELDDYELKYKELISSSSSADQLMLQIIRMTIQHINKCHQEYLDNKWKKNYSTVSTTSTMSSFSVPTTPVSNDTMMSSSYSSASSLDETSSLLTPLTTIDAYSYADLKNDRNQFANNYDDYDEFDDEFFSQNIVHVDTVLQTLKLEYLLNLRFYKIFIDQMLLLQNTDLDQNNQSSSKLLYDIAEGYRKIITDWYLVVLINMTGKYLDDKLDDLVILENNNNNGDGDNNRSVENSSQVEVIKDLFKEIEKLKDLFVE
nr:15324_t:CDS:2 [Entrophospora candida]